MLPRLLFSALFAPLGFVHLPAAEMSEPAPVAARSLLLGVARAGDQIVAVGQFGIVVVSADHGRTWKQVIVPTRAMLTAVAFVDARRGWAVGHEGVIVATDDGGTTWQRQDPGTDLDTVFFDVFFLDPQKGFAAGAYGKLLATADGGKTWTARKAAEEDLHFYKMTGTSDGRLYLAGENGTLLASADTGRTWRRIAQPYAGSLYGAIPITGARLVIFGLRGHILRSEDAGANWADQDAEIKINLTASVQLRDGITVLAGQGGNFFVSRDYGRGFQHWKPSNFGASIAALIETADGALLTVGEGGAVRLALP
jgi:photosystem II stability/assembly factor-like uncharacterized protein